MFFHHETDTCDACSVVAWVANLLLFLATLAALIGVYKTHFPPSGMTFTSPQGAIYLVAFCFSLMFWTRQMYMCCGCGSARK
ncbi:MAG: hypothetical protein G01um101425_113 [Candidatus Peregrinibacteria bacterium Gr01-1014_25]|nr:MAG: hypothetical protein G01um101425_113 [Candidatus Peregrinibacteria bacterium Gr01-1014_25]